MATLRSFTRLPAAVDGAVVVVLRRWSQVLVEVPRLGRSLWDESKRKWLWRQVKEDLDIERLCPRHSRMLSHPNISAVRSLLCGGTCGAGSARARGATAADQWRGDRMVSGAGAGGSALGPLTGVNM